MMEQKIMLPKENLIKNLNRIIERNFDNLEFKKKLVEVFTEKGLNSKVVNMIMDDEKKIIELNDYQLIALAYVCCDVFYNRREINPENYFGGLTIENFNKLKPFDEFEEVKNIELKYFTIKDNEEFMGYMSYEDIYKYQSAGLLKYDIDIQREASYLTIGDKAIKTPTVSPKSVSIMEHSMMNNEFETSLIVFTLLVNENSAPKINFSNICDGEIFNITIEEPLYINDGMHRVMAIVNSTYKTFMETGHYLKNKIPVKFVIGDRSRAKKITHQSFLRADVSKEFLNSIIVEPETMFLDKIISQSKRLKNEVALTYAECKYMNKTTYRKVLIDSVKKMQLDFNNQSIQIFKSKQIANHLDALIDIIEYMKCDKGIEEDYYNIPSMYGLYLYESYLMSINENFDNEMYLKIAEVVLALDEKDVKSLKLKLKAPAISELVKMIGE